MQNRLMGIGLLLALAACSEKLPPTGPGNDSDPVVTSIVAEAGDGQTGEVGAPLPTPLTVRVRDQAGNGMPGVRVVFAVSGGGSVSHASGSTDADGMASTVWTLGYSVGSNPLTAYASVPSVGGGTVAFRATAVLTRGTLTAQAGDGQFGFPGTRLGSPPTVAALSAGPNSRPVIGVVVHWQVTGGDGTISSSTSVTGPSGMASVEWTLGGTPGAGTQALSATVPSLPGPPVLFSAVATSAPGSIVKVSGDLQVPTWGQPLPAPMVIRVLDAAGHPLPGLKVYWSDRQDWMGGSRELLQSTTDALGESSATLTLVSADFYGPTDSLRVASASVKFAENIWLETTFYVTNR